MPFISFSPFHPTGIIAHISRYTAGIYPAVSSQAKCRVGGADIFLDLNPKNAIVYYDDANFMLLTEGTS